MIVAPLPQTSLLAIPIQESPILVSTNVVTRGYVSVH